MSVGIDVIDNDHRKLLNLLNDLKDINSDSTAKTATIGSVLSELIDYTVYHFGREEVMMEACDYPQTEIHKRMHQTFKAQVQATMEEFNKDPDSWDPRVLSLFLRDWLLEHIMGMDKDYEQWMRNNINAVKEANRNFENTC